MNNKLLGESRVLDWVSFGRVDWPQSEIGRLCYPVKNRNAGLLESTVLSLSYGQVIVKSAENMRGLLPANFETYQLLEPGDVVIRPMDLQNDQTSLRVGQTRERGIITSAYISLRPTREVLPRYLFRLFSALDFMKVFYGFGSGLRQNLDFRQIRHIPVSVPGMDEQAFIVRYLDNMDLRVARAIQAKQKLIVLLRERAEAVANDVLLRGLHEVKMTTVVEIPGLTSAPAHWQRPLAQRVLKERIRPANPLTDVQLSLSQRDGLVAKSDLRERSMQTSTFNNWKHVEPGDLVLNRFKAHLGVFFAATKPGMVSFHYGVFRPVMPVLSEYYELLFHTPVFKARFGGLSNGMTVGLQNLSNQSFYNAHLLVPPLAEQKEIVRAVRNAQQPTVSAIEAVDFEIALLREYRIKLISDVVTGKKDVRAEAAGMKDIDPLELTRVLGGMTETGDDGLEEDEDAE